MTAPFSRAAASTLSMNSWCSRCALLTSATVGSVSAASIAISPGWFMPSSTTPARCQHASSWRSRSSVSGRPMWLFRLPSVANAASPSQARRMLAIICVTVVLPLLPVTAISGRLKRARQAPASRCSAASESVTCSPGHCTASSPRSASSATAPAPRARSRKSCASKRSPFSATNRSPSRRLRVSLCTRLKTMSGSPTSREPGSMACASARLSMCRSAGATHARLRRRRRRGCARRPRPG